ncbi:hypothetical protein SAMN04488121_105144 [Chitinophaga filiformis]|uniref:Uncharacterized protein n=1 Tax=Chitinophaga filiformis TaxID=104663 RepID=A0A1G7VJH8_CHIFI|nr:hypothetical protein SAMN04488121_105144 [Chitinophaga filiformis]
MTPFLNYLIRFLQRDNISSYKPAAYPMGSYFFAPGLDETKPDPMINGHQEWLEGLVAIAKKKRC